MMMGFSPHSTSTGPEVVGYTLAEHDHNGERRQEVSVLRGDPEQVSRLIDSLKTVHRYTSGVLAWAPGDNPTAAQIEKALRKFERTAFAGLRPNQYTWLAVLHRDARGGVHIHVVIPRVELTTGKSLNIAPPGWERTFDHLRDELNYEHGWARPDDPARARLVQSGPLAKWPAWRTGEDPRQQLTTWLIAQVTSGHINNRQDVLSALEGVGQVNRVGKDYISVRLEDGAKPIRLKGELFHEHFNAEAFRPAGAATASRPAGPDQPDPAAAEAARQRLAAAVERRARYNQNRYPAPGPADGPAPESRQPGRTETPAAAVAAEGPDATAPALADALAAAVQRAPEPAAGGQLSGLELVEVGPFEQPDPTNHRAILQNPRRPENLQTNVKERVHDHRSRPMRPGAVPVARPTTRDAARATAIRLIEQIKRATQLADQLVERASAAAQFALERAVEAVERLKNHQFLTTERTDDMMTKQQLLELILGLVDQAETPEQLAELLGEKGIDTKFERDAEGSILGWSLRPPSAGWMPGSAIDPQLGWFGLQQRLGQGRRDAPGVVLAQAVNEKFQSSLLVESLLHLVRMIVRLIERLFMLPPGALSGRLERNQSGQVQVVAPEPLPADADAALVARLVDAQEAMDRSLEQILHALGQGDVHLLPEFDRPDIAHMPEAVAAMEARQQVVDASEELDGVQHHDHERLKG